MAWAWLPDNARRLLDRLELEHMRHGGAENGNLPCTYTDFEQARIRRASIALAIRQAVALGFLEVVKQGYLSASGFRSPSLYRLTYVHGCGQSPPPTDEWRQIKTAEEAAAALTEAASKKNHSSQARRKQKAGCKNATSPDAKARLQLVVS